METTNKTEIALIKYIDSNYITNIMGKTEWANVEEQDFFILRGSSKIRSLIFPTDTGNPDDITTYTAEQQSAIKEATALYTLYYFDLNYDFTDGSVSVSFGGASMSESKSYAGEKIIPDVFDILKRVGLIKTSEILTFDFSNTKHLNPKNPDDLQTQIDKLNEIVLKQNAKIIENNKEISNLNQKIETNYLNKITTQEQRLAGIVHIDNNITFQRGANFVGNRIRHLANAVDETDAVNLLQVLKLLNSSGVEELRKYVDNSFFNKRTGTPQLIYNKPDFVYGLGVNKQKILNLQAGTLTTDAVNYGQLVLVNNKTGINAREIATNKKDISDINITIQAGTKLIAANSNNIKDIQTGQGTQNTAIDTNTKNIKILEEANKKQLNWTGAYDSSKTYNLNDVVSNVLLFYISEIDNNNKPLTDTTAWIPFTPSGSIDLSDYYTQIEINNLLKPLETRLTNIETFDEQITKEIEAIELVLTKKTNTSDFNPVKQKVEILFPNQIEQIEKDIEIIEAQKADVSELDRYFKKNTTNSTSIGFTYNNNTNSVFNEWKNGSTRIGYIGKTTTNSNKISFIAELEDLEIYGLNGTTFGSKKIKNISAGEADTDGVNLLQVKELIAEITPNEWELILIPNQTTNSTIATQQIFSLTEAVKQYEKYRIEIINVGAPNNYGQIATLDLINWRDSFGQATSSAKHLSNIQNEIQLKWVNVSGTGGNGTIWIYTNGAILKIWGKKGAPR